VKIVHCDVDEEGKKESVDAPKYAKIIDDHFPAEDCTVLWADGASCHTSEILDCVCKNRKIHNVKFKAAQSYDIQPAEILHGIGSNRVYANGKQYMKLEDLKKAVEEVYIDMNRNNEAVDLFHKLTFKIADRLRWIVDNDGERLPKSWK
jgi:hypothetical protein